ncbi:hypothetical protein FS749_010187 [Ceratobasidium sp. UAMH 11750]|nr:hypothetical protein FS749_010187 [Ceratobasidium sp. UAMH 11750]
MTPTTIHPASRRVMKIPELLLLIFHGLTVAQLAPLLSVNKLFFRYGAPIVWREVVGSEILLGLLTDEHLPTLIASNPWRQVVLDPSTVEYKLPRFKEYSMMVQKLHVHRHFTLGYQWLGLEVLKDHAPLLPGLTELVIRRRRDGAHSTGLPEILALFCGPSCKIVRAIASSESNTPWINTADSTLALAALHPHATSLKHLDFFVKADIPSWNSWVNLATVLAAMTSLSCLGLGADTLSNPVLAAAGQIPGLKVLTLRFRPISHRDITSLLVPGGSFAQLSRLVIWGAWPTDLAELMKLRPLIARIKSALLEVLEGSVIDHPLDRAFEALRDNAGHLEDLDLCFPEPVEGPYELRSSQLLPIISQMPLKRICFRNVCLPLDQPLEYFIAHCQTWQETLTHFIMPCQPATPYDLKHLARFAALDVLAVNITVVDIPPTQRTCLNPISRRAPQLESYFQLDHLLPEMVENLALFLLSCWDDISPVMARRTLDQNDPLDRLDYWVYVTLLKELAQRKQRKQTAIKVQWQ